MRTNTVLVIVLLVMAFGGLGVYMTTRGGPAGAVDAHLQAENVAARREAERLLQYTATYDPHQAARLLREAADRGDAVAWVAWAYVEQNYLERSLAALPAGEVRARIKAARALAAQGHAEAACFLGRYYGQYSETPEYRELAWDYLLQAAEGGFVPAFAYVGYCQAQGVYGPRDFAAARLWYDRAAAESDPAGLFMLGALLGESEYEDHDYAASFATYKRAAEAGYIRAHYAIGWSHETGIGTKVDLALAAYQRGAELGDAQCLYALGIFTYEGKAGLKADPTAARKHFEEAAARGYTDATTALTYIDQAQPVPEDLGQAPGK
jgi:uncharacterized protein